MRFWVIPAVLVLRASAGEPFDGLTEGALETLLDWAEDDEMHVSSTTVEPANARTTPLIIFMEELVRDLSVSNEAIIARIQNELPDEPLSVETIESFRNGFRALCVVPVWFHNFLREHSGSLDQKNKGWMLRQLEAHPNLPSHRAFHEQKEIRNQALYIWTRYCILPLRATFELPYPCIYRDTTSSGDPLGVWILTQSSIIKFLSDEITIQKNLVFQNTVI